MAVQSGLSASELIALRCEDVQFGPGVHVRCHGKDRKARRTPLRKDAAAEKVGRIVAEVMTA